MEIDYDKILAANTFLNESFLSEDYRSKNKELLELIDNFYDMHLAFLNLLCCCGFSLKESTASDEDLEEARRDFIVAYQNTITCAIQFFKMYKASEMALKYVKFYKVVEKNFAIAQDRYDLFADSLNSFQMKIVNDAYTAYIYLIRSCNSMIEAHNRHYPKNSLKLFEKIPEPFSSGEISDSQLREMIEAFVMESKLLEI